MNKLSLFLALLLIWTHLGAQDQPGFAVDQIPATLSKKASVVIRKDVTHITLADQDKYISRHHRVATIMGKKGNYYTDFRKFYKEGSTKISKIEISIYDGEGKLIRSIKSKDIEDQIAYDGTSMISDGRYKLFEYEPVDYPVTIEHSWVAESSNTLSLPTWWPLQGTNISVEESTYEIENNTDIPIRMHARNLEQFAISKESEFSFKMHHQPVVFHEAYSPSTFDQYPIVLASPTSYVYEGYEGSYDNWNGFGKWVYHSLLADKNDLDTESVRSELQEVIKGITDKREIVKKIYDYVQEHTRYILIGLDEGGLVPLSSGKVHEVKYGDCKALSFYMKSLLEVLDIPANYVIIRAGVEMPESIFEEYAASGPANHIIINVPMESDTIWLDCTSHDNPFNFLGDFTDDRLALQVNEDGGTLIRTPKYSVEQNKSEVVGKADFLPSGDILASVEITDHGLKMDKGIYISKMDQKKFDDYLYNNALGSFDKVELNDKSLTIDEDDWLSIQTYSFKAAKYGEPAGDYLLFPAAFLPMQVPRLKKDLNRVNEIYFPRSSKQTSRVNYNLPVGFRWSIPEPVLKEEKFGKYIRTVEEIEPGTFEVYRELIVYKGTYPSEDYNTAKRFFDKIRKLEKAKFSITNKS